MNELAGFISSMMTMLTLITLIAVALTFFAYKMRQRAKPVHNGAPMPQTGQARSLVQAYEPVDHAAAPNRPDVR